MRASSVIGMLMWLTGCATTPSPVRQPVEPARPTSSVAAPEPAPAEVSGERAAEVCARDSAQGSIPELERATQLEPNTTECWSKLGYAYLAQAKQQVLAPPAVARQAFERCLALEPRHAECHHGLARVLEWQDQPGLALEHYFEALRLEPTVPEYYQWPAELCIAYKLYDAAAGILDAGFARLPSVGESTYSLCVLQFMVAQAHDDRDGMIAAMEHAYRAGGDRHPEVSFNLGSTYAVSMPPRTQEALELLDQFIQRVCRGAAGMRFKEQCEVSASLIQKLTSEKANSKAARSAARGLVEPPSPSVLPPLPALPKVPERPLRSGQAYTAWGAGVRLRSQRVHPEMNGAEIAISGIVGRNNLGEAPRCALHPAGVADSDDCQAPIPTFWLCDSLDAPLRDCIQVMGWASNYAQIWQSIIESKKPNPEPYIDVYWGQEVPAAIPLRGAKVTVFGRYGYLFTLASTGVSTDPFMGILTYKRLEWLEPPPPNPKLPGMH